MHSGWDAIHHLYANPIWPFMPTSSFDCMVFDALIALRFFGGAPSALALSRYLRGHLDPAAVGP